MQRIVISKKFKNTKKTKIKSKRFLQRFFILGVSLVISLMFLSLISGFSTFAYFYERFNSLSLPNDSLMRPENASEIYDRNGVRLFRIYKDTSNSDSFEPEEINNIIRAVYMAAEDSNYYLHSGVDLEAIARCAYKGVTEQNQCGGSTITQQVIKLTTKKVERTLDRKAEEAMLAVKLEKEYSKEQILNLYLSKTSYGSNIVGIKTAARFYFGKENLSKLNLAELVTLAAIVNNPVRLSPTLSIDPEKGKKMLEERKKYIFDQLEEKLELINSQLKNIDGKTKLISLEDIEKARKFEPKYIAPSVGDIKAGHFVNYAISMLEKKNYKNGEPFTLEDLETGGYKIYTSLDYSMQQIAEKYAAKGGTQYQNWNVYNAAVMTVRPITGEILTMAGSKNFSGKDEACDKNGNNCKYNPEVNVLTSLQSPGSTNKPLAYYLAFKDSLIFPGSSLPDVPIQFGNYVPKNWDGKFFGFAQTAREMLRQSRNIPALQVMNMIGIDRYLDTAKEFGYTTYENRENFGLSAVLGGGDVYPVEQVQAYSVFANGGDFVELNPILRIENKKGDIIYKARSERKKVADPAAIYLLNSVLNRLDTGTGQSIAWDDREVAGKTGTTENNKDSLLIMYSPDFVTLGWSGNNNNEPLNQLYGWPGYVVAPWLKEYMYELTNVHGHFALKTPFHRPIEIYYGGGDCIAGQCLGLRADYLIRGREPKRGDNYIIGAEESHRRMFRAYSPELQRFFDAYLLRIIPNENE